MYRRWLWPGFALPGIVWLLVLFVVPFYAVLAVALGTVDPVLLQPVPLWNPLEWNVGYLNFVLERLVPGGVFWTVFVRTLVYVACALALSLAIGYPVAYYIAVFGGRRRHLLIALLVLPFFVNYLIRTYAWVALLSDEGVVNGLLGESIRFLNTPWAVILGLVYGYLAFMILPVYAALDRMDPSLIEAGKDLYGSEWRTFVHVTWPTTFQGVLAGSVLVLLPAVGDFVAAQLLGVPDTYMVGNLIQQQFFGAEDWPFGGALTVVMMLFLLVFMVFYLRSAAREVRTA